MLNIDIRIGHDNGMTHEEMLKVGKEFATSFRTKSLEDEGYTNIVNYKYTAEYAQAANEPGRFLYTAFIFTIANAPDGSKEVIICEAEIEIIKVNGSFDINYGQLNYESIFDYDKFYREVEDFRKEVEELNL